MEAVSVTPNMPAIIIANAIALVLLAGLAFTTRMARGSRPLEASMFNVLLAVCAGACIFEPVTWLVDGNTEPWAFALNYIGNTYCYLANIVYAYFWILYTDVKIHKDTDGIRRNFPALFISGGVLAVLVLLNVFGQYFFVISDANVYSRTPLSYICYVYTFACLFFSIHVKRQAERDLGHKLKFFPIYMFLIPVFIGASLQAAFFGLSLSWPGVCIGLVIIHLCLQNELSYLDALTGLYNRAYLDYVLRSAETSKTRLCGIMMDLDFFKTINDEYGHSEGDAALKEVSKILLSCEPARSQVFRFAGDEFVMMITDGIEESALQVEEAVHKAVTARNEASEKPYPLSISMGHSVFEPGKSLTTEEGSEVRDAPDAFMKRIDEQMYIDKKARHAQRKA